MGGAATAHIKTDEGEEIDQEGTEGERLQKSAHNASHI